MSGVMRPFLRHPVWILLCALCVALGSCTLLLVSGAGGGDSEPYWTPFTLKVLGMVLVALAGLVGSVWSKRDGPAGRQRAPAQRRAPVPRTPVDTGVARPSSGKPVLWFATIIACALPLAVVAPQAVTALANRGSAHVQDVLLPHAVVLLVGELLALVAVGAAAGLFWLLAPHERHPRG